VKIFFLWRFYREYLESFYGRHPELFRSSFDEQRRLLLADHFGWQADLSRYLTSRGYTTEFVVANARVMQETWAREAGFTPQPSRWETEIVLRQVAGFRPDVLWMCAYPPYFGAFVHGLRKHARKIVLWAGEPWPTPQNLDGIDVLITENPMTYRDAHQRFRRVVVAHPGVDPNIAAAVGHPPVQHEIVFIGQFLSVHRRRAAVVADLIRAGLPVKVFGTVGGDPVLGFNKGWRLAAWLGVRQGRWRAAANTLRRSLSPTQFERDLEVIRSVCRPPVFGMEMFKTMAASRVVLNVHADIAGTYAGNMRLFEATIAGACLLTDWAGNLSALFEPEREVLVCKERAEWPAKVRAALADPQKSTAVARAGQMRTLREHTVAAFYERVREAVEA